MSRSGLLAATRSGLFADLVAPSPGRSARAVEIACACTLVVLVSMTYGIPDPALSGYIIFFVARENSGQSIVLSTVFVVVLVLAIAMIVGLSQLTASAPNLHPPVIAAVTFGFFFLAVGSKLAPIAPILGLVVADGLYKLGSVPVGELQTRGLLYSLLFACMPLFVFIAYSLVFGRHPEAVLRRALCERLRTLARSLRDETWQGRAGAVRGLGGGNAEMLGALKMIGLLHRQPKDTQQRLAELVKLSYAAVFLGAAVAHDRSPDRDSLATWLDDLAERVARLPRLVEPAPTLPGAEAPPVEDPHGSPATRLAVLCEAMDRILGGSPLPAYRAMARTDGPVPEPKKSGFFVPGAFTSSLAAVHAFKATAAVMICYLTISILDWPGIGTSMVTCFVVVLGTLGETTQKLVLRVAGCLIGALAGVVAIVFLLPGLTSITALLTVVFLATLPAAWIAVGRPSVAYIGFQIVFAFYLCVLQGAQPKFDLIVARDRVIGILFGIGVTYLIFATVYPVSILTRLRADVVGLIERCRAVLASLRQGRSDLATAQALAEAEALLGKIRAEAEAFGYEGRLREGRLQAQATRLSLKALRGLVDDLGRLAAYPPAAPGSNDERNTRAAYARIETQLGLMARDLGGGVVEHASEIVAIPGDGRGGRGAAFASLQDQVRRVSVTLARYRRVLSEGDGSRARA